LSGGFLGVFTQALSRQAEQGSEREAMLEFLTLLVLVVLGLTIASGIGAFALNAIYGDSPPPNVTRLADTFTDVYAAGASVILGALRFLRHPDHPPPESETKSHPPPETRQIGKQ
jgi:hypothetical protein